MQRSTEISLLEELQGLKDNGRFFLDETVHASPITRYADAGRFEAEMAHVFRKMPLIAAHASELPEPGSFLTRSIAGLPVLVTRDRQGAVHAFLNVCRHRGARLVDAPSGCKHVFSCPYHAWTYSNTGALRGVPHRKPGFPGLDRNEYGLKRLPAAERLGIVWIVADPSAAPDFDAHVAPIADDFAWFDMDRLGIARSGTTQKRANWKLLVEGGIEAYHFKVAHEATIGPHFLDNLSSYQRLGPHMRSVLPRESLPKLAGVPHEEWAIRDHANVLYTLFPLDQFLLMQDHVAWIALRPMACDRTEIRLTTLAPREEITPERDKHWARNHAITTATLEEDFDLNEAVQDGVNSGANQAHTFGRYEGALHSFNREVEARLGR